MTTLQIVVPPDVVDVLRHEHEQIRRLRTDVQEAGRDRKKRPFAALRQAVHRHQFGESAITHPAVRTSGPDGGAVALDLQARGGRQQLGLLYRHAARSIGDRSTAAASTTYTAVHR